MNTIQQKSCKMDIYNMRYGRSAEQCIIRSTDLTKQLFLYIYKHDDPNLKSILTQSSTCQKHHKNVINSYNIQTSEYGRKVTS